MDSCCMWSSRVEKWRHTHKRTVTLTPRLLPLVQTSSGLVGQCTPHSFKLVWGPAEEEAAVSVWVWLSGCGCVSTTQPRYSTNGNCPLPGSVSPVVVVSLGLENKLLCRWSELPFQLYVIATYLLVTEEVNASDEHSLKAVQTGMCLEIGRPCGRIFRILHTKGRPTKCVYVHVSRVPIPLTQQSM